MSDSENPKRRPFPQLVQDLFKLIEEFPPSVDHDEPYWEAGGYLHRDDPVMVEIALWELEGQRELYPELSDETHRAIQEHQEYANEFLLLTNLLDGLIRYCRNMHTQHQLLATKMTRSFLLKVLIAAENPEICPHLNHRKRVSRIGGALMIEKESRCGRRQPKKPKSEKAKTKKPKTNRAKAARKARLTEELTRLARGK